MTNFHPEYLFNDYNDQDFVLKTDALSTPELALQWLRDFTGADYEEIGMYDDPIWLKPGPVPEEFRGYYDEDVTDFYSLADADDPDSVEYWYTEV